MSSRRAQKAAEAIREVVSMAILTDLRDPRIANVTVTYVEMAADMRSAKVHVSVMGSDNAQRRCLEGLSSAAGYLQSLVGRRIDTRYTPRLKFVLDMGVKRSIEISRILQAVLPKPTGAAEDDATSDDDMPENPGDPSHNRSDVDD